MTWSDLAAECPTCSERRAFSGEVRSAGAERYTVHRCEPCGAEFTTWRPRFDAFLARWEAAPPAEREAVLRALHALRTGDNAAIAATLAHPRALPFLRFEETQLPADVAGAWGRLVLDHDGFVPEPGLPARVEEALAIAVQSGSAAPVAALVDRLDTLPLEAVTAALSAMPARLGASGSGTVLRPLIGSLRARGGAWAELAARVDRRWVIPALRGALEP